MWREKIFLHIVLAQARVLSVMVEHLLAEQLVVLDNSKELMLLAFSPSGPLVGHDHRIGRQDTLALLPGDEDAESHRRQAADAHCFDGNLAAANHVNQSKTTCHLAAATVDDDGQFLVGLVKVGLKNELDRLLHRLFVDVLEEKEYAEILQLPVFIIGHDNPLLSRLSEAHIITSAVTEKFFSKIEVMPSNADNSYIGGGQMKKLTILLRGAPGAGKSKLARELAGSLGGKIYSADELLMAEDVYVWSPALVHAAHCICQQLVNLAMSRGEMVIVVDNTHLKPRQARPYVEMAKQHGYDIIVREPNTPWKHDLQSLLERGTHALPPESVEHMLNTWLNVPLSFFRKVLEIE